MYPQIKMKMIVFLTDKLVAAVLSSISVQLEFKNSIMCVTIAVQLLLLFILNLCPLGDHRL